MENVVDPKGKGLYRTRLQTAGTFCLVVLGILLLTTGIALRVSVMNTGVRAIVAATLVFAVYTGLVLTARLFETHPRTLYPVIFFVGMGILWGVLANKLPSGDRLSATYVHQLRSFEGTRYVSGGEASSGVDCSGLARSALWQAMLVDGARTFNPYLLGPRLWKFWWRDMSAVDMLYRKHGYTIELTKIDRLAGYDHTYLRPGDLAVVEGGEHVLIYVGDNQWIEATSDDGKVVVNEAALDSKRPYFNVRVTLMRWWIMQGNA